VRFGAHLFLPLWSKLLLEHKKNEREADGCFAGRPYSNGAYPENGFV